MAKWIFDPFSNKIEFGILIHANGDVYEGSWNRGKQHGIRVFIGHDGKIRKGEWRDDKQHGVQ